MKTSTLNTPKKMDTVYDSYFTRFLLETGYTNESFSKMNIDELEFIIHQYIENTKPLKNDKRMLNNSYSGGSKKIIFNAIKHSLIKSGSLNTKLSNLKNFDEYNHSTEIEIKKDLSSQNISQLYEILYDDFNKLESEKQKITKARNLILFKLLIGTGIRVKELLECRVSQINNPVIKIIREHDGSDPALPMQDISEVGNPVDLSLIQYYIDGQELRPDDYMFASGLKRKPLTYEQAYKIIRESGRIIGLDLSPHSLRKYYITSEIEKGTSENVINQIVGYTDNSVMIKKIKQQSFWEYGDDE